MRHFTILKCKEPRSAEHHARSTVGTWTISFRLSPSGDRGLFWEADFIPLSLIAFEICDDAAPHLSDGVKW
jgi:hypothetical protein